MKTLSIFVSNKVGFYLHTRLAIGDRYDFQEPSGAYNPSYFGFKQTAMCCIYETKACVADLQEIVNVLFIMFAKKRLGIPINVSYVTGEAMPFSDAFLKSDIYHSKAVIRDREKCYHYHCGEFTEIENDTFVAGKYSDLFMKYMDMGFTPEDIGKNIINNAVGLGFNITKLTVDELKPIDNSLDTYRKSLLVVETKPTQVFDFKINTKHTKLSRSKVQRKVKKIKPRMNWRPVKKSWPKIETITFQ